VSSSFILVLLVIVVVVARVIDRRAVDGWMAFVFRRFGERSVKTSLDD